MIFCLCVKQTPAHRTGNQDRHRIDDEKEAARSGQVDLTRVRREKADIVNLVNAGFGIAFLPAYWL